MARTALEDLRYTILNIRPRRGDVLSADINTNGLAAILASKPQDIIRKLGLGMEDLSAILSEEVGVILPERIIRQLGLETLSWQFVGSPKADNLTSLFLGYDKPSAPDEPFEKAIASLYFLPFRSQADGSMVINRLSLAGVGKDSLGKQRVVGVSYSTHGALNATGLDVSISDQELPKPEADIGSMEKWGYADLTRNIPSSSSSPHFTNGFITEGMKNLTKRRSNLHNKVIFAYDSRLVGDEIVFIDLYDYAKKLGFSVLSTVDSHKISYNPPAGLNLQSWNIAIPKSLVPVKT